MISVIVVTRGRPHNIKRLCQSLDENTKRKVELVFAADEDDHETIDELHRFVNRADNTFDVKVSVDFRDFVPQRINNAFKLCNGDVIALWGDDVVVHTLDWNTVIEYEFNSWPKDNIGVVYCQDGRHNEELCAHPFISRRWIEVLGYAAYDKFFHYFVDTWLYDIAKRINRLNYVPDVMIQHLHCDRNKAPVDNIYLDNFRYFREDEKTFEIDTPRRIADAGKLLTAMRS